MDDNEVRLIKCFLAVFPELTHNEVQKASSTSVSNWDSIASVALLTEVEEEFGINIDVEDLSAFLSFRGYQNYLKESEIGIDAYEPQ
jgi:acyl carrier protein